MRRLALPVLLLTLLAYFAGPVLVTVESQAVDFLYRVTHP